MKKILSIVLFTAMILTMFVLPTSAAWDGTTASTSLKGEGTAEKPYLVATAEDLAFLAKDVNGGNNYAGKYITQTADIDLGGKEWTPIGITNNSPFCGVYNGLGHKVTGLSITKSMRFLGFFGYIKATDAEAGVANLTLEGSINITSDFANGTDAGVGCLAGWIYQDSNEPTFRVKIINVTNNVDLTIKGLTNQPRIGAVAGYVYCADFENVVNNGNVNIETSAAGRVSGVAGQGNRSTYTNVVNNGNVTVRATGSSWAAGAGISAVTTVKNNSGSPLGVASTYVNCVNNGDISVTTDAGIAYAAGLVANPYHGGTNAINYITIDGCVNTGDIFGKRTDATDYAYVGGFVAYNNKTQVSITNSVNSGVATAEAGEGSKGGGIAGVMNNADPTCFIKDCVSANNIVGWSAQDTDKENSKADADEATVKAGVKAIEAKLAPSATKIAGFDTAYKAPAEPEKPDTPVVPTGDAAIVLAMIALVSLAGVVVTKKVSVR